MDKTVLSAPTYIFITEQLNTTLFKIMDEDIYQEAWEGHGEHAQWEIRRSELHSLGLTYLLAPLSSHK